MGPNTTKKKKSINLIKMIKVQSEIFAIALYLRGRNCNYIYILVFIYIFIMAIKSKPNRHDRSLYFLMLSIIILVGPIIISISTFDI